MKTQTNVERFFEWMQRINNQFLHDHNRMVNVFRIVALNDVNDIEVNDYEIVKSK
jgi:hypothetical protein